MTSTPFATVCPTCGTTAHGRFCGNCGTDVTVAQHAPNDETASVYLPDERVIVQPSQAERWPTPDATPYYPQTPPRAQRSSAAKLAIGLSVVLVGLAAGLGYVLLGRDNTPISAASSTPPTGSTATVGGNLSETVGGSASATSTVESTSGTSSTTAPTSPTKTPTAPTKSVNARALETLREARVESLDGLRLNGRWVLQLASKMDGTRDNSQVAEDGGHVFRFRDILAEHDRLVEAMNSYGFPTLLLLASDFGTTQNAANKKIWVTLVDPGGIADADAGRSLCASFYPTLQGAALANVCLPRRLILAGS